MHLASSSFLMCCFISSSNALASLSFPARLSYSLCKLIAKNKERR